MVHLLICKVRPSAQYHVALPETLPSSRTPALPQRPRLGVHPILVVRGVQPPDGFRFIEEGALGDWETTTALGTRDHLCSTMGT